LMVLIQFVMLFVMKDRSWPAIFLVGYCFGGVINHSLMLAVHEISHNLAFGHGRPMWNKMFGFFANLPIGIPISISFRKYHLEHHKVRFHSKCTKILFALVININWSTLTKLKF
jgi:sphingolipid delta-4 desaturase